MDWWGWILVGLAIWVLGIALPIGIWIGKSIRRADEQEGQR